MGLLAPVGVGKHRGLGVEHGSVGSWPCVGGSAGNIGVMVAGRERDSAGSGYGRSLSLAVATTRTRSLVVV